MKFEFLIRKLRSITVLAFLIYFLIAVGFQTIGGAYSSELGEHADEAAHYVTGMMVRDYIASIATFHFESPLQFAKEYYQHYPKVGLGHWPPGFYIVQAAWTLIFTAHRASVMVLLAVMAALLAALLFDTARREFPVTIAFVAGLTVVADPLVQAFSRQVMAELMTATLVFSGVVFYAWYLDREETRFSLGFGASAGLAALTKGTGFLMAGIPPLGILFTSKFRLLLKPSFWAAALVVLLMNAPWYLMAPGATHESALPTNTLVRTPDDLGDAWFNAYLVVAGVAVIPFFAIGLLERFIVPLVRGRRVVSIWAVAAASIISMIALRAVVPPARPARHLMNILPVVVLFTVAGVVWVLSTKPLSRMSNNLRVAVAAMILIVLFASDYHQLRRKEYVGFSPIAEKIISNSQFKDSVVLISSDSSGEGMFISELATRDGKRPGHYVLRGTKVISSATWFGWNALVLFNTPDQLNKFLTEVPIGIIVFDTDPPTPPLHHSLLAQTLKAYPQQWQLIGTFEQSRGQGDERGAIQVYRLVGHEGQPVKKLPSQLRRDMS